MLKTLFLTISIIPVVAWFAQGGSASAPALPILALLLERKELDPHPDEASVDQELEQDTLQTEVGVQATRPSLRTRVVLA